MIRLRLSSLLLAGWLVAAGFAAEAPPSWQPGMRVIVDKAGAGHRAIVLRTEEGRCFVAYEGVDEQFDEWIETGRIRRVHPERTSAPAAPASDKKLDETAPTTAPENAPPPEAEILPRTLDLPRPPPGAVVADVWLEAYPRASSSEPLRFNTAKLTIPLFRFGEATGIASVKPPLAAVLLRHEANARPWGFAAIEAGVTLYRFDERAGITRAGELDLSGLGNFRPEVLQAGDFNDDGQTDLVVAGGPVLQVFFGTADGRFVPSAQPYRAKEPVRAATIGHFFAGALPWGIAAVEGDNTFRLFSVARTGITPNGSAYTVKFERITRIVAGDFDGDGFSDIAVATESNGRATGAWMYFNQHGAGQQPFLWPLAGKDDFACDLCVADLDHDGRDDLIMTDSDVARGERIRIVFGAEGRAGWEDPWELIGNEFGVGLGTASIVVADFNRDGRLDVGIAGRNGLRVYLGADYRRFSRNPIWPRIVPNGDFPEQRAFLAADLDGDGAVDLLSYTPAFATGYNLVFNATAPTNTEARVPAPLRKKAPTQGSTTIARAEGGAVENPTGAPVLRFLASRVEPYGQYRFRIVVEIAVLGDGAIESLEARCKYEGPDTPLQESVASVSHQGQQWFVETTLPRGRDYNFTITARDDKGRTAEPLRVNVQP